MLELQNISFSVDLPEGKKDILKNVNLTIGDGFTITALASQCVYEEDSFGNDYDTDASFPSVLNPSKAEAELENGRIPEGGLTIAGGDISATVPEDVKLEDGAQKPEECTYGKSITDPCLGWGKTEKLIYDLAEVL